MEQLIDASKHWRDSWTDILNRQSAMRADYENLYSPIAGADGNAQALVWQDMAGWTGTGARVSRFVKRYADLRGELLRAAREYAEDVRGGSFPGPEHSFE